MMTFSVIVWGRFRSSHKLRISFLKEVALREAAGAASQPDVCHLYYKFSCILQHLHTPQQTDDAAI